MVIDYYAKYPDPELKIVKKDMEGDDGGGKQPAEEGTDESSDDGDSEQSSLNGDYMFNTT